MNAITEKEVLKNRCLAGMVNAIDRKFADFLLRLSGEKGTPEQHLAFLLLSHTVLTEKHVCLDLRAVSETALNDLFPDAGPNINHAFFSFKTPPFSRWVETLTDSPVVGRPGEYKPIILSETNRLYLYRYHEYERSLAESIKKRILLDRTPGDPEKIALSLKRFFPNPRTSPDWQKVAAYAALTRHFVVISGGPGTGKTHTITAIMAMLLEQNPHLKISLSAPTGKAAARMQESIRAAKTSLDFPQGVFEKIPENASTIHRLLGVQKQAPHFRHHKENPLQTDILIVDEASMISMALLSKLVDALPDHAAIILIGDRNQLASVEAGAVFGDISDLSDMNLFSREFTEDFYALSGEIIESPKKGLPPSPLSDCVVELKYSYRFEQTKEIGELSKEVYLGNATGVLDLFKKKSAVLTYREISSFKDPEEMLSPFVSEIFQQIFSSKRVEEAFSHLERFRILCSRRNGDWGVIQVNRMVEKMLFRKNHIDPNKRFYKGRPILILQNDYTLGLYNGDVGIVWEDETGSEKVFFPDPENQFRTVIPARLPGHETVFAMTIHKSQGSEFDSVLMILPEGSNKLLSRELVYTGITRARGKIELWTDKEVLERALLTRVERWSGLGSYFAALEEIKRERVLNQRSLREIFLSLV